jgi:ribosomal protein L37AE/L43A
MSILFKKTPQHKKSIEIISKYSDSCPRCQSDDISNEDDSENYTCHKCSHQFTEEEYMDKIHIIALLNVHGLPVQAQEIESMDDDEFEDFLFNNIYA